MSKIGDATYFKYYIYIIIKIISRHNLKSIEISSFFHSSSTRLSQIIVSYKKNYIYLQLEKNY